MDPVTLTPKPPTIVVKQWQGDNLAEIKDWCGIVPAEAETPYTDLARFLMPEERPEDIEEEWDLPHVWNDSVQEFQPVQPNTWFVQSDAGVIQLSDEGKQTGWLVVE